MENEFHSSALVSELKAQYQPEWGIVLGSGLGAFVNKCVQSGAVAYSEVPGLPVPKVPGHAGRFVFTKIAGQNLVIAQGRPHLYEGYTAREVSAGVRFMAALGVSKLILTNAAGAIHAGFEPGEWMLIEDHINLTGASPLTGGPNFLDMSGVYSEQLGDHFFKSATWEKIPLHRGVYAGVSGPQYETPAEVRMLKKLGADAVGMSTVIEAIQAHALGIEVAGFSLLTNRAAGLDGKTLNHNEVLEMAESGAAALAMMISRAFDTL